MNREEWLSEAQNELRASTLTTPFNRITLLPSFPARPGRKVKVGELITDDDLNVIGLVSPLLADSLEVMTVAYWLLNRRRLGRMSDRSLTTNNGQNYMRMYGWTAPYTACLPSERLIDILAECTARLVRRIGEYPAAEVNLPTRRTQTTRLLKVECSGAAMHPHDPYILRMSQSQADRGLPHCGVCSITMSLA